MLSCTYMVPGQSLIRYHAQLFLELCHSNFLVIQPLYQRGRFSDNGFRSRAYPSHHCYLANT
jgi:hypothetical protein